MTSFLVSNPEAIDVTTIRKVRRRLIPFAMLAFFICFLDRANISVAALQMNGDIGLSPSTYGFGAGIFFVGYVLFEVPSNLILYRVGARLWIARIMVTWGLIASAMMFVQGTTSFYTLRFLLGFAEAGLYPGMIVYLSRWFPDQSRGRALSIFQTAAPLAAAIGTPLMSSLYGLDGVAGLRGWQWIFLVTGIPAVIAGVATLWVLTDSPERANWLTPAERSWLVGQLDADRRKNGHASESKLAHSFVNPRVWLFSFIYFLAVTGQYGLIYWLPRIVQDASGAGRIATGFLSALPWCVAVAAVLASGWSSDRWNERRWHICVPLLLGAVGLLMTSTYLDRPVIAIAALCLGAAGINAMVPPLWGQHALLFSGIAAASSAALINSIANFGGFLGPSIFGALTEVSGNARTSLLVLAGFLTLGGLSATLLTRPRDRHQA